MTPRINDIWRELATGAEVRVRFVHLSTKKNAPHNSHVVCDGQTAGGKFSVPRFIFLDRFETAFEFVRFHVEPVEGT